MSEEEKDPVEIVEVSEEEEELSPEELKELEGIMEEIEEEDKEETPVEEQEVEPGEIVEVTNEVTPIEQQETETKESEEDNKEAKEETMKDSPLEKQEPEIKEADEKPGEPVGEVKSPTVTTEDLGGGEGAIAAPKPVEDKPPIITGHVVPQDECWLLKRNKTGFTLPKELRDKLHPQQNYALVLEGHELAFYMINEEDIPKLRLVRKKAEPKLKGKRGKRGKKKKEGPEPDFPRYFHFELEDQGQIQDALESAFYKFAANPPAVGEAMNIVIYVLTSFIKNHRMNDSRLRQTVIFFLCHIVEQFKQPQLIDFCQREIIDEIKSAYLYQICLNQLAYTSFIMDKPEKADEFITLCVEVINRYDVGEMYAIMDSFKHLIHTLTPIQGKNIEKEKLGHVKESLIAYVDKLEDFDYQVQYIEMLERMNFIEEAYNTAQLFLDKLDEESTLRDSFKEIMRRIGKE